MSDKCAACKEVVNGPFCSWHGPPFSMRLDKDICYSCLCAMKPKTEQLESGYEIAIIGTCDNDVQTLINMMKDGFDKKEATKSIRSIGRCLGLSQAVIREKLKPK